MTSPPPTPPPGGYDPQQSGWVPLAGQGTAPGSWPASAPPQANPYAVGAGSAPHGAMPAAPAGFGTPGDHGPFGPPPQGAPMDQQMINHYMHGAWATPPPPQDAMAVVSLVLGILGLLIFPLLGVAGLVLGLLGLRRTRAGTTRGTGIAVAGIVLGGLAALFSLFMIAILGLSLFGALGSAVGV